MEMDCFSWRAVKFPPVKSSVFQTIEIFYRKSYTKFSKIFEKIEIFKNLKIFENFSFFSKTKKWKYAFDFFALRCAIGSHFTLRANFLTSPSALNAESSLLSNALPLAYKLANLAKREPIN